MGFGAQKRRLVATGSVSEKTLFWKNFVEGNWVYTFDYRRAKKLIPNSEDRLLRVRTRVVIAVAGPSIAFLLLYSAQEIEGQRRIVALPQVVKAPLDNPLTPERIALGKLLFWDPILSGNKDVACSTCHHPRFGYAENRDLSIGVNGVGLGANRRFISPNSIPFVKRNSQTILNAAFNGIDQSGQYNPATAPMFWDIRVESLENQALEPIKAFEELFDKDEDEAIVQEVAEQMAKDSGDKGA